MHLLWLKRDLRLSDHAALYHAAKNGSAVLPVYIVEPDYWQQPDTSLRQWAFVAEALTHIQQQFIQLGQPLLVYYGAASRVFRQLLQQFPISAVYSHEETGNLWSYQRDLAVTTFWQERGIPWHQFKQFAVFRPLQDRDRWFKQADDWLTHLCILHHLHCPLFALRTGSHHYIGLSGKKTCRCVSRLKALSLYSTH